MIGDWQRFVLVFGEGACLADALSIAF